MALNESLEKVDVRTLRDPIHDHITLSKRLCQFIDTRQFQRLRAIKQLGTSYYVWPGGCHNRFEHCIGVSHLARKVASILQEKQPELHITDRDVECVEIAGLCHDLGHGPWSHVWDGMFIPVARPGTAWTHEQGSEMMLNALIEENHIDVKKDDLDFIKALIAGDPKKCRPNEKPFLFDIVANKRNGLDVDKFDYIRRDSHMIGDQGNISLQRLLGSARVIQNQICYNIKDANQIFEICATRFRLHKTIYNHKTAKAIEYMIIDGLLAADPFMKIADRVFDAKKMVHLTDNIRAEIEQSEDPELAPARAIFNRIITRDLYRCAEWKTISWHDHGFFTNNVTPERIVAEAKKMPRDQLHGDQEMMDALATLAPQHIIVDFSPMHYGMKEKNPMENVRFYSKREPNKCAKAEHGDYSTLMPAVFGEVLMRVYVKDDIFYSLAQIGYRAVIKNINPDADADLTSEAETVLGDGEGEPQRSATTTPPRTPKRSPCQTTSMASIVSTATAHSSKAISSISYNKFATVPVGYTPTGKTRKGRDLSAGSLSGMSAIKESEELEEGEKARGAGGVGLSAAPEIKERSINVMSKPSVDAESSKDIDMSTAQADDDGGGTPKATPTRRSTRGTKRRNDSSTKESETSGGSNKRAKKSGSRK
ncbi:hypothetical protein PTI98_004400 [Pleurotus ostreatus]|nr:hypothetical protein PTI98_004400 [Pleurotus ostreatus]